MRRRARWLFQLLCAQPGASAAARTIAQLDRCGVATVTERILFATTRAAFTTLTDGAAQALAAVLAILRIAAETVADLPVMSSITARRSFDGELAICPQFVSGTATVGVAC
jgi:hypothetical protein